MFQFYRNEERRKSIGFLLELYTCVWCNWSTNIINLYNILIYENIFPTRNAVNAVLLKRLPELYQSRCNLSAINANRAHALKPSMPNQWTRSYQLSMSTGIQAQLSMSKRTQALKPINAKTMGTILSALNVNTDTSLACLFQRGPNYSYHRNQSKVYTN